MSYFATKPPRVLSMIPQVNATIRDQFIRFFALERQVKPVEPPLLRGRTLVGSSSFPLQGTTANCSYELVCEQPLSRRLGS